MAKRPTNSSYLHLREELYDAKALAEFLRQEVRAKESGISELLALYQSGLKQTLQDLQLSTAALSDSSRHKVSYPDPVTQLSRLLYILGNLDDEVGLTYLTVSPKQLAIYDFLKAV